MSLYVNPEQLVHLFNQGNRRKRIFRDHYDYLKFLEFFRRYVSHHVVVVAYCLMPNHFHFQLEVTESGSETVKVGSLELSRFSNGIRLLQSMYAKYYNRRHDLTGNLFRQKAKLKPCENEYLCDQHSLVIFEYIHSNPVKSGLVKSAKEWPYSSYQDYAKKSEKSIVNTEFLGSLLSVDIQEHMKILV